ncbi:MAG: hypothetical protein J3K34DRAFT_419092 [Monoraphidium minutum]|nr:MAG: hypothetical protein J3K34DRAFT_419092 [Monoraphidium minutum]
MSRVRTVVVLCKLATGLCCASHAPVAGIVGGREGGVGGCTRREGGDGGQWRAGRYDVQRRGCTGGRRGPSQALAGPRAVAARRKRPSRVVWRGSGVGAGGRGRGREGRRGASSRRKRVGGVGAHGVMGGRREGGCDIQHTGHTRGLGAATRGGAERRAGRRGGGAGRVRVGGLRRVRPRGRSGTSCWSSQDTAARV